MDAFNYVSSDVESVHYTIEVHTVFCREQVKMYTNYLYITYLHTTNQSLH